ncbi:MAG: hypothetical protein II191_06235 [Clostridia bacterium]|nr:hypothetical protein [Clostridia bacterium]
MARSLKNIRKSETGAAPGQSADQPSAEQMAAVGGIVEKYSGKSENELMAELFRVTGEQKRNGSFDPEAMQRTAESIMPALTPEQRNKLMSIIGAISQTK